MVRCPSTWDQRGLLENGYPLGGYQVFAGTSEWDRMEATPVRWISARRAGIAAPQAYVFHRSSRRAGIRIHSLVLEEMGSKTDRRSIQSSQRPFGALRLARNEKRPLLAVTPCGAHASFVEESLGTDHIGVAWVDGQGVRPCRLSRFTILLTWCCRIRLTFLRRCSARFARLMTMSRKDACNRVVGGDHRAGAPEGARLEPHPTIAFLDAR